MAPNWHPGQSPTVGFTFFFPQLQINVDVLDVYWMHNFSDAWKVARISVLVRKIQLFMPSWPFSRMMAYLNDKESFQIMHNIKISVYAHIHKSPCAILKHHERTGIVRKSGFQR